MVQFDKMLIGFVLFSIIFVSGSLIANDLSHTYDVPLDSGQFNDTFNKIDEMYNITSEMKNNTFASELEGDEKTIDSMYAGTFGTVRLVKDSFSLIGSLINQIALVIGIPAWMTTMFMIILTILIVWGVIYFVRGFSPT